MNRVCPAWCVCCIWNKTAFCQWHLKQVKCDSNVLTKSIKFLYPCSTNLIRLQANGFLTLRKTFLFFIFLTRIPLISISPILVSSSRCLEPSRSLLALSLKSLHCGKLALESLSLVFSLASSSGVPSCAQRQKSLHKRKINYPHEVHRIEII